MRRAERGDEAAGFLPQLLLPLGERLHLTEQAAVRLAPRPLELLRVAVDLDERLLERRELRLRKLQERLVVPRQRLGRERLEPRGQPLLGPLEQLDLLRSRRALVLEGGLEARKLGLVPVRAPGLRRELDEARARRQPDEAGADENSDEQERNRHRTDRR